MNNNAKILKINQKNTVCISKVTLSLGLSKREHKVNSERVRYIWNFTTILGVTEVTIEKENYRYIGELDIDDKPCGFGVANDSNGYQRVYGLWLDGCRHGISK